ncbi:MAG: nuclear transport factor 2 family protein [Gemmatimonadaceae bacterium]
MLVQNISAVAQQAYEAFSRGDIPGALSQLSDDVEWIIPAIEGVPFSGTRRGRAQVAEFFAALAQQQDVIRFEPKEYFASDEKVVALGSYEWKVKSTGRTWGSDFAHIFVVRDGKVVRFQEITDTMAAAAAYK